MSMYFVNLAALKEQHKQGQYQQQDSLAYLVVSILLIYLPIFMTDIPESGWTTAESVVEGALLALTAWVAYRVNGGNQGSGFLDKFLSVSWVVGIRLLPFGIIVVAAAIYGDSVHFEEERYSGPYNLTAISVFYLAYLWRVGAAIKDISSPLQSNEHG